jgi:uncharacterized repeat protein (TIGR03803 family)
VGVIFEYDFVSGTYTKKIDFNSGNGGWSHGSLVEYNGQLYGMAISGGTNACGTIFRYDYNLNICQRIHSFDCANGGEPYGSLVVAPNGKFYGLTPIGGAFNKGVLFEFDPATSGYAVKHSFDTVNGFFPLGSLVHSVNGKLYGMTRKGGAHDYGTLFEYDYAAGVFVSKLSFDGINGMYPEYGQLLEFNLSTTGVSEQDEIISRLFPNPASETVTVEINRPKGEFVTLQITDLAGREIESRNFFVHAGVHTETISLNSFIPGIYILVLTAEDGSVFVHRMAVQ